MEWWLSLLIIFGSLVLLMVLGLPVAFAFLLIDIVGAILLWNGAPGLQQLIFSFRSSVAKFSLLPLPMFILMGEIMFRSAITPLMMDALDRWIGKLPGRLSLLAVGSGTIFATLTGMSMSSIIMLGTILVPEMEKRGYKKAMSIGPILGAGPLAIMIPPSTLAILLGVIGQISIGQILVAIILPGLVLASCYAVYIILRCKIQPSIAPPYDVPKLSIMEKIVPTVKYVLPIAFIIFLVIGLIMLGVATPSESAACGAIGCILLALAYRKLHWNILTKAVGETVYITSMMLMIILGATAFSHILAYTGATGGMGEFVVGLPVSPIFIIISMQIVVAILGCFMDVVAIMMVTLPIFVPVVVGLGFNPVWFAVLIMINLEMASITPPFGMGLFAMHAMTRLFVILALVAGGAGLMVGCERETPATGEREVEVEGSGVE